VLSLDSLMALQRSADALGTSNNPAFTGLRYNYVPFNPALGVLARGGRI
jgi:hypothetical protein